MTTREDFAGKIASMKTVTIYLAVLSVLGFSTFALEAADVRTLTGILLEGHTGGTHVAFAPDARTLFSASEDNTGRLWNVETAETIGRLDLGEQKHAAAFSPDGRWLALRGGEGVKLLHATTLEVERVLESKTAGIPPVTFSRDSSLVASGDSMSTLRVWETATGKLLHTFKGTTNHLVFGVAFLPDGTGVVGAAGDGVGGAGDVTLWDSKSGKIRWRHSDRQVWKVTTTPDGSHVVFNTVYRRIGLLDAQTGKLSREFETSDVSRGVAVSPDGKWLAATARKTVEIWELATGRLAMRLVGHENWVTSLAFSADNRWLATGSSDKTVRVWELE
jgi:WD40 repeat protein